MKYIASCSFGKDSLAMLIKIKELNLPLDEVIYCDIRFDKESLSGEMPLMREFIPKAEKILYEKYNIKVKRITSDVSFLEQFYKTKKRGKDIGNNYGFPYIIGSWCNDRLKLRPIKKYLKSFSEKVIQYVGIAYDEPKRYERLNHETHIAPLYDLKITEKEAINICKENDLLSPIYETSFRGGCWFCPKQSISQLENLWLNYPELFNRLLELEKDSFNTFKVNRTLKQFDEKFKNKYKQFNLF